MAKLQRCHRSGDPVEAIILVLKLRQQTLQSIYTSTFEFKFRPHATARQGKGTSV